MTNAETMTKCAPELDLFSPRVRRLRELVLARGGAAQGKPGYRAWATVLAATEMGAGTWGQRRAYMLKVLVERAPLSIAGDERIVGEHLFSEKAGNIDFSAGREGWQAHLAETGLPEDAARAMVAFYEGEGSGNPIPYVHLNAPAPELSASGGWDKGVFWANGWTENHSVRDFAKVVRIGFRGVREEVEAAIAACDITDPEYSVRRAFWQAALAVCDAGICLGRRYAALARTDAETCEDPVRRAELLEVADMCIRVPEHGARSLREAAQAIWFTHMLTCAEDHINANSIGRLDQILYPYYRADVKAGCLTREEAVEWMQELACKLYRDYDVQQVCLGGLTPGGGSGVNEMTYIILDATERLDFIRCISVRLNRKTPRKLLRQCARLLHKGGGIPFFFLDEAILPALTARGVKLRHARDYAPIGCVEITIPGKATPHAVSGALNAAKCLELALFDGQDPKTGEQYGPQTGGLEDFETFDDLVSAYRAQAEYFSRLIVHGCNHGQRRQIERGPLPLYSTLTEDCIRRGRDIHDGGALYNYHSIMLYGAPNVADSLMALKRFVFEEGSIERSELLRALRSDFEGAEPLRRQLLSAPKYGNDIPEVDELAAEVTAHFCDYLDRFRAPFGGFYAVHLFTFVWHLSFGQLTGATPDGRRVGEPLAYSLSPQQGRDREGLTAMMNSLARIPHHKAAGSSSAILEIDPSMLDGDRGADRLADILATGIDLGIGQMQFNVTTVERLERAQADPEHYGNIQVRVSGYSSKFSLLNKDMQDHIIARTKHRL